MNIWKSPWLRVGLRLIWYLTILLLIFMLYDTADRDFRYWGL